MLPALIPVRFAALSIGKSPGDSWTATVTLKHRGPEAKVRIYIEIYPDLPLEFFEEVGVSPDTITCYKRSDWHTFPESTDWREHTFTISGTFPSVEDYARAYLDGETVAYHAVVAVEDESGNHVYAESFQNVYAVSVPPFEHEWGLEVGWS